MAKDPRHEIGELKYYRAVVGNKERVFVKEKYPDDEDLRGVIMKKRESGDAILFGMDFGAMLTSTQLRDVAEIMDAWEAENLNPAKPGTTQPSLLERVREFAGSLKALTDSVPTGSAYYGMNVSRASERAAYNVALNRLYDRFPELKDLSAGEQG